MAKKTAVIDIGSNSCRMVVFEKTSRFGFRLLQEIKSKVRISEGAYENEGYLQKEPMRRAYVALRDFLQIAHTHGVRKTLCVATSALRDAPNSGDFLRSVERELGLKIKVIDGAREAYLGGVAAANLLPLQKRAVTVDIGGGSTEFALIENAKVLQCRSLDVGTVRVKELFFDKGQFEAGFAYIKKQLERLDFHARQVVAIGGTARAISKSMMKTQEYPLDKLHGFAYGVREQMPFIQEIFDAGEKRLKKLKVKADRVDTIKSGSAIFMSVLEHLDASQVITSGVGVREGVYLTDLLRRSNHRFPANFNPSIKTMCDKYYENKEHVAITKRARALYALLRVYFDVDGAYERILETAAKLSHVGRYINIYKFNKLGEAMILNELNYGFTHKEIVTIASLVRYSKNKLPPREYNELHPPYEQLCWLSFIISLSVKLNGNSSFELKSGKLHIRCDYVIAQELENLQPPEGFEFFYTIV